MPLDQTSPLAQAILEHLELKRRNAGLEFEMPLTRYLSADPNNARGTPDRVGPDRTEDTITGVLWPDEAA
jgi:hypothetical protein